MIEDKNQQRTSLGQLGEFGLIDHLTQNFKIVQPSTLKGIGDDAAVLDFGTKKAVCILCFETNIHGRILSFGTKNGICILCFETKIYGRILSFGTKNSVCILCFETICYILASIFMYKKKYPIIS